MTSTSDLKKIRDEQNKLLTDTVYIQRLTRVLDSAGGWSGVWQTVATVRGRIAPTQRNASETVQGGAVMADGEYIVTLPYDTELQQEDRLQIGSTQYEVMAIMERSEKTALRATVKKV